MKRFPAIKFPSHPLALLLVMLGICLTSKGQIQSGNFFSNYSGILAVGLNPANASYENRGTDLIGFSFSADLGNNSFKTEASPLFKKMAVPNSNPFSQKSSSNFLEVMAEKYRLQKAISDNGFAFANATIQLPSFLIKSGSRSYGLISSIKSLTSSSHLPPELAEFFYNGAKPGSLEQNKDYTFGNFELISATYADVGINFSDLLIHGPKSELRVGMNIRALIGFNSCFYQDMGSTYRFRNDTIFHVDNAHFSYGFAFVDGNSGMSPFKPLGFGMGVDFGLMYQKFSSSTPALPHKNKSNIYGDAYDFVPYQYKFGISITDIGGIGYGKETRFREMSNVTYDWSHIDSLALSGIFTFDKKVMEKIGIAPGTELSTNNHYYIKLPSKVNLLYDFHLHKFFYCNIQFSQRINLNDNLIIHGMNRLSVAPRYETKFFEIAVPVSLVEYRYLSYGLYARIAFLYLGTNSLPEILGIRDIRNMDFYFGLKFSLASFGKGREIRL